MDHVLIAQDKGEILMSGLFLCFLLVAAGQDLKRKSVEVRVYGVFGVLALFLIGYYWWTGASIVNVVELCSSVCIGIGMLGGSFVWKEGIGVGDGCFFLVSGLMLGFWHNLALLCYGLLLCSIYCLCFFVWSQVRFRKNVKHQTVPFLPFLVPVGVWIVLSS